MADGGASVLEPQLHRLLDGRYPVRTVADKAALTEELSQARQAVVVFSAPPEGLPLLIRHARAALPGTACIAVVEKADPEAIPVLETDCYFLVQDADDFTVLNQVSMAVRQAELLALLADGSHMDEVTNLFNRPYFMQRLGEEMSLSRRHLSPVCCVILGLGFYKVYVDSYGYDFVNALLRFVADKVGNLARHEDLIARTGDDEIGILLPRSTEKGAKVFTNRLILTLNASTFRYGGNEENIEVSAGVAGYPLSDDTSADADTLIRYARHALHQARCAEEDHTPVQLFSEIRPVL